ncbi:hypothetical protein RFI_11430, partial [Reticulomyxa filosa]
KQCFEVKTLEEIQPNEELYICYEESMIPNIILFLKYGFILDNHWHDSYINDQLCSEHSTKTLLPSLIQFCEALLANYHDNNNNNNQHVNKQDYDTLIEALEQHGHTLYWIQPKYSKEDVNVNDPKILEVWNDYILKKMQVLSDAFIQVQELTLDEKDTVRKQSPTEFELDKQILCHLITYWQQKFLRLSLVVQTLQDFTSRTK